MSGAFQAWLGVSRNQHCNSWERLKAILEILRRPPGISSIASSWRKKNGFRKSFAAAATRPCTPCLLRHFVHAQNTSPSSSTVAMPCTGPRARICFHSFPRSMDSEAVELQLPASRAPPPVRGSGSYPSPEAAARSAVGRGLTLPTPEN